jgi:putative endonuclease
MIYQRLAKVFLICSNIPYVIPANAGTHNPWRQNYCRELPRMNTAGTWYIYILASRPHGTLYIGITNNLRLRLEQHRVGRGSKFVKQYDVHRLVHVEEYSSPLEAIAREKQLKNWRRDWKIQLIEENNLHWGDLSHLL